MNIPVLFIWEFPHRGIGHITWIKAWFWKGSLIKTKEIVEPNACKKISNKYKSSLGRKISVFKSLMTSGLIFWSHASKLIITQVKNKITYHAINWVRKLKDRRRVINKQRAKVLGMLDVANSSYSTKDITENYSVWYGGAMLVLVWWGTLTWRPETSGNIWSLLWFSQNASSLC